VLIPARDQFVPAVESLEERTNPDSTSYASLYANLLHRSPSQNEIAVCAAELDSGVPAFATTSLFVVPAAEVGVALS